MKRILSSLFLIWVAFVSVPGLSAKNPPKTEGPPPPVWDTRGKEVGPEPPSVFNGPRTFPPISAALSGALLPRIPPTSTIPSTSPLARPASTSTYAVPAEPLLTFQALNLPSSISPQYTTDASNAAGFETEPAIVSLTKGSTTYTAESYQHNSATEFYTVRVATSTSPQGGFVSSIPYVPTPYTDAFDSIVTTNPYTDGVRPGAVYVTACLAVSSAPGSGTGNPMQIRVWGSDDGGGTWTTSGQVVAYTQSGDPYILDKPVSDVSWYSGSRGYLYVAWTQFPTSGSASLIRLRRNTNGLWQRCRPVGGGCDTAWDAPVTVNDGFYNDGASEAQVVANPDNGHVYVFWLSNITGQIQMRRSTDYGATFQPALTDGNGNHQQPITVITGVNVICGVTVFGRCTGNLPNGLRGTVVPTIRYNTAAHNMMVAWHDRTHADPTNETALYFASFDPDTINGPLATSQIIHVNDAAGTQMQPAIDNDDSGNVLMTYFTTENHLADNQYQLYGIGLSASGQVLPGCGPTPLDGTNAYPNGFLGDYHDSFYFTFPTVGSLWNTSWTRTAGSFDVMLAGVK